MGLKVFFYGIPGGCSGNRGRFILFLPVFLFATFLGYAGTFSEGKSVPEEKDTAGIAPRHVETKEVVVYGDRQRRIDADMPGTEAFNEEKIRQMPAFLGERDVLRAVQTLPGVQSVSEGTGGLFVRGGSNGQNLFLLDGMEILNPSHLMGIYSVFNPLLTKQVELYRGNAPVSLQSRLASTVLVESKNPLEEPSAIEANVGNISSTAVVMCRRCDGRAGVSLGYRRSYLEGLEGLSSCFLPDDENYFKKYGYRFFDLNGKFRCELSRRAQMTAAWYAGGDHFGLNDDAMQYHASTDWGNRAFVVGFQHKAGKGSLFKHAVSYSTTYSQFGGDIIESTVRMKSDFTQWQQQNQWMCALDRHFTHVGCDFFYQHTHPLDMTYFYLDETFHRQTQYENAGTMLYASDCWAVSEKVNVYFGLRSVLDLACDSTVRKLHVSLSPVLSVSVRPNARSSVKASCSMNHQHLHLASFSSIPLPNDIWVTSTPHIRPENAQQLTVGYYRAFGKYEWSLEAYGKYMQRQLLFAFVTSSSDYTGFEEQFMVGKGAAYGVDFSLRKTEGLLTGALSYSLSRSKRCFSDIQNGKWFNDKYDRPHDLSIQVTYRMGKRWNVSALWTFASGANTTLPTGRYWLMGSVMNDYDGYNTFRLPSYHRLDVSADYTLRTRHFKESVLNFSIVNVYNRANPYYVYFKVYTGASEYNLDIRSKQVSLFPILPSISWRFKL